MHWPISAQTGPVNFKGELDQAPAQKPPDEGLAAAVKAS